MVPRFPPLRIISLVLLVFFGERLGAVSAAYPVAPAATLAELEAEAEVVFKGQVVGVKAAPADALREVAGFRATLTRFRVIQVHKGKLPAGTGEQAEDAARDVTFLHYTPIQSAARNYAPQSYQFRDGRCYWVFAKHSQEGPGLTHLREHHRTIEDQGVVLAADSQPRAERSVKAIVWAELTGLLRSKELADIQYGIEHLNQLTGGPAWSEVREFSRNDLLDVLAPLLDHDDPRVLAAALDVLGSESPYGTPGDYPFVFVSLGAGHLPGLSQRPLRENLGGRKFGAKLLELAGSSNRPAATRGRALRALGWCDRPEWVPSLLELSRSNEPEVAEAALLVLSDYVDQRPSEVTRALEQFADDARDPLRRGVAHAVGFAREPRLLRLLEPALKDKSPEVQQAAALSLLSYPLEQSKAMLLRHRDHPQYRSLFINALALNDPQPYLRELGEIIRQGETPRNWWGGSTPWGVSWELVFCFVRDQAQAELRGGKFDAALDALESPLDVQPSPRFYSSSLPRDLYALYVRNRLRGRAMSFRKRCVKRLSYDIDRFFAEVDQHPERFPGPMPR